MANLSCKIVNTLEVCTIEVVKNNPQVCHFCGKPHSFCLAVFYNHNPIITFDCCVICHSAVGAIFAQLTDKIKSEVWVSLDGAVPAYFEGGQFERDLRTMAGFLVLPPADGKQCKLGQADKGTGWEAEE